MIYTIFSFFGTVTGFPFRWLFFRDKIYLENDRASRKFKGGALVISNHFNPLDYVMNAFVVFPRKLYVVASEDAFRSPFRRFGMKFWGGIQANRVSKSMGFVIQSIKEIRKGHLVQIFPEGHNTPDGKIHPFYPSYILIALKANCPIIPVITDGNYGFFKRVHLMIGEPIDLNQYLTGEKPSKQEIAQLNDIVYNKVLQLRQELDRRIEADRKRGKKQ